MKTNWNSTILTFDPDIKFLAIVSKQKACLKILFASSSSS